MATISAFRSSLLLLVAASVLATVPAAAEDLRAPHPVAYYDVDSVVREARALDPAWRRVAALEDGYVAESAPLRAEVDELRTIVRDRSLPDAQRRVFEAELAQRTIALLVLRTESMREIVRTKEAVVGDVDHDITAAVARVAREQGYVVVIRTDRDTRVLDEDAIDLTPHVVAELDRAAAATRNAAVPAPAPQEPQPDERHRTRMQACAGDAAANAACADAGS